MYEINEQFLDEPSGRAERVVIRVITPAYYCIYRIVFTASSMPFS